MTWNRWPDPYPIASARDAWYGIDCPFCDWHTTGHEPVCEEAWHEHAHRVHPRRYRRSMR
jgi:hypothetical protein